MTAFGPKADAHPLAFDTRQVLQHTPHGTPLHSIHQGALYVSQVIGHLTTDTGPQSSVRKGKWYSELCRKGVKRVPGLEDGFVAILFYCGWTHFDSNLLTVQSYPLWGRGHGKGQGHGCGYMSCRWPAGCRPVVGHNAMQFHVEGYYVTILWRRVWWSGSECANQASV